VCTAFGSHSFNFRTKLLTEANHPVGAHFYGEAGGFVSGGVGLLGVAAVEQVAAEALAAHGGGAVVPLPVASRMRSTAEKHSRSPVCDGYLSMILPTRRVYETHPFGQFRKL